MLQLGRVPADCGGISSERNSQTGSCWFFYLGGKRYGLFLGLTRLLERKGGAVTLLSVRACSLTSRRVFILRLSSFPLSIRAQFFGIPRFFRSGKRT